MPRPAIGGHRKSQPIENQALTRKAFALMLALHGMKNERNERRKALILGLIIAAAVLALGLWESAQGLTPNH